VDAGTVWRDVFDHHGKPPLTISGCFHTRARGLA
jgi:hypothetical protein